MKSIGNSIGVMSKICNKSWLQIDDSGDRTSYLFKPNNQLHLILNGVSQIIQWKYFPENERLVIYFFKNEGASFQLRFIENDVLLSLKADNTGDLLILTNEGNRNAPKTINELDLFFKKKNASLVGSAIGANKIYSKIKDEAYTKQIALVIDKVLSGCNNDLLVEHINYFKKIVPGFDYYYKTYLEQYQSLKDYDYFEHLVYSSKSNKLSDIITPLSPCKSMDKYFAITGDSIKYEKIQIDEAERLNDLLLRKGRISNLKLE